MNIPFYERHERRLNMMHLAAAFQFPLHLHGQVELAFCRQGRMEMLIDAQPVTLHAGDVALIFPNHVHGYILSEQIPQENITLIFDAGMVPDYVHILRNMQPTSPLVPGPKSHPDVTYALAALDAELAQPTPDEPACRALLGLLLARLIPSLPLQAENAHMPDDLMHRTLTYLAGCYTQRITLEETASALHVSPYHLSHLFSDRLGMGFRAYINALRLNQAEILLRSSSLSITQICYDCGFESQRTFNRVFLKSYGVTPRIYRQLISRAT